MMRIWSALAALIAWGSVCYAGAVDLPRQGITTKFVEVLVDGVPLASRYVLEAKPVEVLNNSRQTVRIRYEALTPDPSELRPGYEPIPDPAWISFEPREFDIEPGRTGTGKLVLYLPGDPAQVGKRYQAMLLLRTVPTEGSFIAVGLKPRFMFTIAPKEKKRPPQFVNLPRRKARIDPFELMGKEGTITVPCGFFKVKSVWPEEMTYEMVVDLEAIKRVDPGGRHVPLPDPSWLEIRPPVLVLNRNKAADIAVVAHIPIASEHFGKRYVAALRTVATRKGHKPVDVYNRVVIKVPEPEKGEGDDGEREADAK